MKAIVEYLQAIDDIKSSHPKPKGWHWRGMEEIILKFGESFHGRNLPKRYKRGEKQLCFNNSLALVTEHDDLIYVEGFAQLEDIPIPLHHAWCIEEKTGRVVDPTKKFKQYFGVPFRTSFVSIHAVNTGYPSIFDDWSGKNPFLVYKLTPEKMGNVLYRKQNANL